MRDGHDHFRVLVAQEEDYTPNGEPNENDTPVLSTKVKTKITDHNNGIYTIDYEIVDPGIYHIAVTLSMYSQERRMRTYTTNLCNRW